MGLHQSAEQLPCLLQVATVDQLAEQDGQLRVRGDRRRDRAAPADGRTRRQSANGVSRGHTDRASKLTHTGIRPQRNGCLQFTPSFPGLLTWIDRDGTILSFCEEWWCGTLGSPE